MHLTRPGIKNRFSRYAGLLLLTVLPFLSACVGTGQPPKPIYYYTLNHAGNDPRFETVLPCTLRVERFTVSPPFDSQRIYYADGKSHRNAYAYHQWVVSPGDLIPYLFTRDLRQSNGFRAVLTPHSTLAATHSLHGWIEEFIEKDNPSKLQASVIIHLTLISNHEPDPVAKIMLQKQYKAEAPSRDKTPAALAEAMSKAVADISTSAVEDIYRQLSASPTLKYR